MAKALQRRRGTTEEHKSFTGLEGEFTYDTTEKRIVAHDGATAGGIPMAKKSEVDAIDVGVTSFNGSKGAVTYSAPVSSVNGKTGAVTVDVGVTSVNGKTGAVTGIVTSVNGTNADASGNVAITTGTVSQVASFSSFDVTKNGLTKTISGLTPYKPLFVMFEGTGVYAWFQSGTNVDKTSSSANIASEPCFVAIPTGTSVVVGLDSVTNLGGTVTKMVVYQ